MVCDYLHNSVYISKLFIYIYIYIYIYLNLTEPNLLTLYSGRRGLLFCLEGLDIGGSDSCDSQVRGNALTIYS